MLFFLHIFLETDSPSGLHNAFDGKNQNSPPLPSVASRLASLVGSALNSLWSFEEPPEARGYNTSYTQFFSLVWNADISVVAKNNNKGRQTRIFFGKILLTKVKSTLRMDFPSAFDLPPLLFLVKNFLRHNFSHFKEMLDPTARIFQLSLALARGGKIRVGGFNISYTKRKNDKEAMKNYTNKFLKY